MVFDLLTQLDLDSDDMRTASDQIPLDQVLTSMTINAPVSVLLMFLGCGGGWSVRILSLRCDGWAASPALIRSLRELLASDSRRRGREAQAGSHDDLTEWHSQPSLIVLRSEIAPAFARVPND